MFINTNSSSPKRQALWEKYDMLAQRTNETANTEAELYIKRDMEKQLRQVEEQLGETQ